jgi:hypothetical protein
VDDLRGSPMTVGNLEEIIDDDHAIVSSSVGPEHYVTIMSFVDKDLLEPGCSILLHNKVRSSFPLPLHPLPPLLPICASLFPSRCRLRRAANGRQLRKLWKRRETMIRLLSVSH